MTLCENHYESRSKISLLSDRLNILQASSSLAAKIQKKFLFTEGSLEMVSSTQIASERICKISFTYAICRKISEWFSGRITLFIFRLFSSHLHSYIFVNSFVCLQWLVFSSWFFKKINLNSNLLTKYSNLRHT
jgi:hypothetical protein